MSRGAAADLNVYGLSSLAAAGSPFALIFPGQGSQRVGMAQDVYGAFPSARAVFDAASTAVGIDIAALCFNGPAERLTDTANAQPAILTASLAYLAAALESGALRARPAFLAGHSLGEYSALVAAGCLTMADSLNLVTERGRLMAEAGAARAGTMAAILGLEEPAVNVICEKSGAEPANYNGPTQIVLGGAPDVIARAVELTREMGGKALPVNVSGAFHTSFMVEAAQQFAPFVDRADVRAPQIPVVANASATSLTTVEAVRDELKKQIATPVQWTAGILHMISSGVESFIEFGPGRALSAMVKRISPDIGCSTIDSLDSLSEKLGV